MNRIFILALTACTLGFFVPAHAQITYGLQQNVIPWQEGLYLAGYEVLSDTWIWADILEYAEGFGSSHKVTPEKRTKHSAVDRCVL